MTENLIIFNARVVTPVGFSARRGREMEELCIIDDATVEVTGGVITYVGPNRGEERDGYYQRYWHYNARGKCLCPALSIRIRTSCLAGNVPRNSPGG